MTGVESFLERSRVVSGVVRFGTKGSDIEGVRLGSKDSGAGSNMRVGTSTVVTGVVLGERVCEKKEEGGKLDGEHYQLVICRS